MKVYLDNCVLSRPFDDQKQARIKKETEAVLALQDLIRSGAIELVWSYIVDFEVSKNPFDERRRSADDWKSFSIAEIGPSERIVVTAKQLRELGLKEIDSLHVAAAVESEVDYFLTTDDGILGKIERFQNLLISNPVQFLAAR